MQPLIDTIQAAVADGATAEQRRAAAVACRTLLAAFDAEPGKPIAAQAAATAPSLLAVLGRLAPDQALDLLIAKLRAAVPAAETQVAEKPRGFHVQLLHVPPGGEP
ncbi:MAG: hypothetical protein H6709_10610 [Kofleriaceae bacterium]|nr:hypothetical protein [Myxococcales bacterium]MCB9564106.1 hypothetical protein [Kofleriaceae bacterium]MCB9572526.1 hypothetical protein [Kofleriaceae bacterium]